MTPARCPRPGDGSGARPATTGPPGPGRSRSTPRRPSPSAPQGPSTGSSRHQAATAARPASHQPPAASRTSPRPAAPGCTSRRSRTSKHRDAQQRPDPLQQLGRVGRDGRRPRCPMARRPGTPRRRGRPTGSPWPAPPRSIASLPPPMASSNGTAAASAQWPGAPAELPHHVARGERAAHDRARQRHGAATQVQESRRIERVRTSRNTSPWTSRPPTTAPGMAASTTNASVSVRTFPCPPPHAAREQQQRERDDRREGDRLPAHHQVPEPSAGIERQLHDRDHRHAFDLTRAAGGRTRRSRRPARHARGQADPIAAPHHHDGQADGADREHAADLQRHRHAGARRERPGEQRADRASCPRTRSCTRS